LSIFMLSACDRGCSKKEFVNKVKGLDPTCGEFFSASFAKPTCPSAK